MIKYEVQYTDKRNEGKCDCSIVTMAQFLKAQKAGFVVGDAFKRVDVVESKIITDAEMPWIKI